MKDYLTSPRFAVAVFCFEQACAASREHSSRSAHFLQKYGDHGSLISGCVRDHFPPVVKDELRQLAQTVTRRSAEGHAARPRYVRAATMINIARLVATRDGSGFYGPQAYGT